MKIHAIVGGDQFDAALGTPVLHEKVNANVRAQTVEEVGSDVGRRRKLSVRNIQKTQVFDQRQAQEAIVFFFLFFLLLLLLL
jgi:ribosomal protein L20A (L18A)